jgi:hypothetical protein
MKQEVRRGRKFVEYHDPETQDEFTFTQEISGADVSYQETDGYWNPVDESWETDGLDGFSFRAHRMNHKVRFDSIGAWRWYPRRNVETEYIVINRPKCWLTATKRWGNLLVNGISREGRDITLTSVRKVTRVIHSRWNGIKTDWILLDSTAPTKFRQQIDLVGLTELDGWLYGADGEKVALLTPTTAIGADGAELPCSGSYVDGYLQFEADVTGAVFPVTIDPDFAAHSASCSTYVIDATFATQNVPTNAAKVSIDQGFYVGLRTNIQNRTHVKFNTSTIDDSVTITQANLTLTCITDNSSVDFSVAIQKQDWSSQDPPGEGNKLALYNGCLSANSDDSAWRNTNGMSTNTPYTSGNLSTAWINKTGYTYYGLISQEAIDNSAAQAAEWIILANEANATESYRPKLTVTYTASGGFHPINMTANMQSLTGGMRG